MQATPNFRKANGRWAPTFYDRPLGSEFSVGEWNMNPGGGRFAPVMRSALGVAEKATRIKAAGGTHMEFHDTEALPKDAPEIMRAVTNAGLKVWMATANLFKSVPLFANGNFGSRSAKVRAEAVRRTTDYISVAIEVYQCPVYVFWNGSNGTDIPLAVDYDGVYRRTAECLTEVVQWMHKTYGPERSIRLCIEPKPNEPRGWGVPADVGEAIALISMMPPECQNFMGLNPEVCHSQMAGKRFAMELGLATACDRLGYVHLNGGSESTKFDEDHAFGDVNPATAAEIVLTLQELKYSGVVGLDVQPLPTDREDQQAASVERSIRNFRRCQEVCKRVDLRVLNNYRDAGDQASVADLWAKAVFGTQM